MLPRTKKNTGREKRFCAFKIDEFKSLLFSSYKKKWSKSIGATKTTYFSKLNKIQFSKQFRKFDFRNDSNSNFQNKSKFIFFKDKFKIYTPLATKQITAKKKLLRKMTMVIKFIPQLFWMLWVVAIFELFTIFHSIDHFHKTILLIPFYFTKNVYPSESFRRLLFSNG